MADISNAYWNETDASNNAAAPNGWTPGVMLPSDVEPTAQTMMGAIKRFWNRVNAQVTTTGAAGSYVYTPANPSYPSAILQGEIYGFVAHQASVGNDTFTISGTTTLGPYNLYVATLTGIRQIKANEIVQNQICSVQYSTALGGMLVYAAASLSSFSPAFAGIPTAPTAAPGTNTTQLATTAFATQLAFQAALPAQGGATAGSALLTDGAGNATWVDPMITAAAGGTSDAITATFTPAITLRDKQKCFVICSASNTTTAPTFSPNGLTAHPITMAAGQPLAVGSIAGAGFVALLEYNLVNTRWELLNPAGPAIFPDYASLRTYTGAQQAASITGYLGSSAPSGAVGNFTRDDTDTTSGAVMTASTAPVPIPSAPVLSQSAGGSMGVTTYYVKITYVTAAGETLASAESSFNVGANNVLGVASPSSQTGATGYNVYVSTSAGTETKQNSSAISIGADWTEPTSGLVAGSALPSAGTAGSVLTVTSVASGTLALYNSINRADTGASVGYLQSLLTGAGGIGTYLVGTSSTLAGTFTVDNGGTTIVASNGKRWKRFYTGPANIRWFGAVGAGNETLQFAAATAASREVLIPSGMTLSVSNCTLSVDLDLTIERGATLLHYTGSDTFMLKTTAVLQIQGGGTLDGNRANQSVRPDMVIFNGTTLDVRGMTFKSTITNAINVWAASGDVRIVNNLFYDMAEHTGVTGQGSQGIYIGNVLEPGSTLIEGNRFFAGTPSVVGRSPGGIQVAVSDYTTMSASCRIIGNYFYQIGMSAAGNFLGCIDLYTQAKSTVVANNVCIRPAYIALKLQNCPGVSCTGNVIRGYSGDTSVTKAMIMHAHARSELASLYGGSITGNTIDLSSDTTQACIEVTGDLTTTSYPINAEVVSGNTCIGGARSIVMNVIGDVAISGNAITGSGGTSQAIRFVDMQDLGARVAITGNNIRNVAYGVIATGSEMKDAVVSVNGNIFADVTTAAVSLISDATRVMKAVNIQGNTFVNPSAGTFNIDVRYATDVLVQGNAGQPAFPTTFTSVTKAVENDNSWNVSVYQGNGSPEGVLTARVGALYQRMDGATGFTLYTKESGSGNTGWNSVVTVLSGLAVYDPPNLAAGATQQTTVTVTGATTSDSVIGVSHSAGNSDCVWFGEVTAADTVTVTQWNRGASAVDVGNGNLRVKVIKN